MPDIHQMAEPGSHSSTSAETCIRARNASPGQMPLELTGRICKDDPQDYRQQQVGSRSRQ